jgi:hypothetical protein
MCLNLEVYPRLCGEERERKRREREKEEKRRSSTLSLFIHTYYKQLIICRYIMHGMDEVFTRGAEG